MNTLFVFDECRSIFPKKSEYSEDETDRFLEQFITTSRSSGIGRITITQEPESVAKWLSINSAFYLAFPISGSAIDSIKKSATKWQYKESALNTIVLTKNKVIAGGKGVVIVLDSENGKELNRFNIDGRTLGLAVAEGHLFAFALCAIWLFHDKCIYQIIHFSISTTHSSIFPAAHCNSIPCLCHSSHSTCE